MTNSDRADVVIAGAGMAGALFAGLLATSEQGGELDIVLVEPKRFVPQYSDSRFDVRVVALTEASRRMLDAAGTWTWLAERRCCPYRRMEVRDADGTGLIQFDCSDVHRPELGHIVENSLVVEGLLEKLAEFSRVRLMESSVAAIDYRSERQVALSLADGQKLSAGLLVAADGALSPVREMCGIALREWQYGHQSIVTTIATERQHQFTARQWFSPDGPLAFLPLRGSDGGSHHCAIVWSQKTSRAEALLALDDQAFCRALTSASEQALGEVQHSEKRFAFPLHQRHAVDYVTAGAALIGDAAHTIHPLAGQGINLGFKDASVLVEELNRALDRGLPLGSLSVLERYQRRRKPDNLGMMAVMEGFKRLFESEAPLLRILRNEGMSQLDRLNPIKNLLAKQAMGL